ncbi:sigma-70 family RNA polymerase sigma factor [Streptomyces avermitilis]|uniref:sigma-70 family RNA polymerase sigma factor n=1 Tax=Streptomyces avermitilis TaxID=33903 RepID=UPI0033BE8000
MSNTAHPSPDAFPQHLVCDHTKVLTSYVERLLHDRHSAEDIVQETFIRAWQHAERLEKDGRSMRGWLFTVARNLVVDRLRSAAYRNESIVGEFPDAIHPDSNDVALTTIETTALLGRLSHEHREVITYTYIFDKTVHETARILGVPAGTVKSRRHYALNKLRKHVSREETSAASDVSA